MMTMISTSIVINQVSTSNLLVNIIKGFDKFGTRNRRKYYVNRLDRSYFTIYSRRRFNIIYGAYRSSCRVSYLGACIPTCRKVHFNDQAVTGKPQQSLNNPKGGGISLPFFIGENVGFFI